MGIHVVLRHQTVYDFDRLVDIHPHVLRLRPAPHCRTPILAYSLHVEPARHFLNWQQDPFGNYQGRLVFPERARSLKVDVEVIADLTVIDPFDFFIEPSAEHWPFPYDPILRKELAPYLEQEEAGPLLRRFLLDIRRQRQRTVDFLVAINQRLQGQIGYTLRMEAGVQTPEETLKKASGSCRDSAWLMVQVLRHMGLAARFVSGYLVQLVADQAPLDGPAGPASDFTDLHAWVEVYVPGAGWIGLDPTSGLFAGEGHIPLACTPHYESAAPITGATGACEAEFHFANTVTRLLETPRVTKPYTDGQWERIMGLGDALDQRLQAADMRLTMGGEPTFVATEGVDAAEWNQEALGMHKRERAETLVRRLGQRFAPGALLHTGEGKWYPGEALPRWALGLYWRKDGFPLWRAPRLLAEPLHDYGWQADDIHNFACTLTRHLQLDSDRLLPAYEDAWHILHQEGRTPINIDLSTHRLDDPLERQALIGKLQAGLDQPVGWVLPLAWDWKQRRWYSAPWSFRGGRLILLPGDSPLGMRLPLDSLPWVVEAHKKWQPETDPFAPMSALPDIHGEIAARDSHVPEAQPSSTTDQRLWEEIPHTAVTLEIRKGCLYCFFPPLQVAEHYLYLLGAVEHSATELNMPVVIEGYAPPSDPRVEKLLVTPDPGVIEVNIHPSTHWQEMVKKTTALYDDAHACRLTAEKFMLDGRHTGTGGGNHMTLGGATPGDSPFLRRPDLLQSLITYWQHHPALSYFFSGMFIGPTSQSPRVDEARHEALYELEIAFAQVPPGIVPQPWLVDRLFRNLLVDITGNTHRAEICIDKLYSPVGAAGRQGLVELRAFEMPPHARMSLAQQLLVRSLLLRFWETPYRHELVRWGTALHDRFMLPHYLWEDLRDICADLQEHDIPFHLDWLAPFSEFRFPRYGHVRIGEIDIELRAAIEPWHVLGEEMTGSGTARYVDSSVERLQVRVTGMTPGRHVLACNGRRVPLQATRAHDAQVAGVRYRAWQPPSALHPTIPVHTPLTFDLIDTWNGRSVGGCSYHVMHPGGRNPEAFPVNAWEAEARRQSRFTTTGHSQGPQLEPILQGPGESLFVPTGSGEQAWLPPHAEDQPDYPHTLDLRMARPMASG
ncbi:MAG: transglutaminase family protein [Acidithiobacillus sp.]|jgi:uncharacterized protein (DUF2126 family)/transglutaminase-like putative cysteine protease|uniref:transglutaminase family protein n=1 Tax=Acidithiobacillus sp. TaxID=1872118 RepID=UPI00355EFCDA